jgi:hypothetical protein
MAVPSAAQKQTVRDGPSPARPGLSAYSQNSGRCDKRRHGSLGTRLVNECKQGPGTVGKSQGKASAGHTALPGISILGSIERTPAGPGASLLPADLCPVSNCPLCWIEHPLDSRKNECWGGGQIKIRCNGAENRAERQRQARGGQRRGSAHAASEHGWTIRMRGTKSARADGHRALCITE